MLQITTDATLHASQSALQLSMLWVVYECYAKLDLRKYSFYYRICRLNIWVCVIYSNWVDYVQYSELSMSVLLIMSIFYLQCGLNFTGTASYSSIFKIIDLHALYVRVPWSPTPINSTHVFEKSFMCIWTLARKRHSPPSRNIPNSRPTVI